ncbi:MAG: right-handed parallel beta-helix repeat-containing protein [Rikenellaceae bacterium]
MRRSLIFAATLAIMASGLTTTTYSAQKRDKKVKAIESVATVEPQGPVLVEVSSLDELMTYLPQDNITLKMAAGEYLITADDIKAGKFTKPFEISPGRITYAILPFEGNNCTYDFSGVTIGVESGAINSFPGSYFEVSELHMFGNDNVVKNLKLVDRGSVHDFPKCSWVNVIMDGARNRLDGVEINSQGSKPYGYGEVFGKGKDHVIAHKKHCGWLVRGDANHVKDCRIIHHSYGHYLFIQGCDGALIEGVYIEGEVVTTDSILAEEGSGSAADKIGFKTVFGYTLPKGYTLSTGEDGIRTYANGSTMIDGVAVQRPTGGDIVVKDCVVKHARSGISLTEGSGTRYVENCTLIGCQDGYSIRSGGKIVNCRADAAFGPALRFVSSRDRACDIDITITPYEGDKLSGNGSRHLAHIFGSDHKITLRKGEGLEVDDELSIWIGGDSFTIGNLGKDQNFLAPNVTLINETGYRVVVDEDATDTKVTSNGQVVDNGVNSTIN